jgi:hypothetical protein
MGPDPAKLREIARSVEEIMRNDPNMRTVNVDWGERVRTSFWIKSDCSSSGFTRSGSAAVVVVSPKRGTILAKFYSLLNRF